MENTEDKILWVSKYSNTKSLGSAISRELEKEISIVVRGIGVQAINQAVKAIAVAGGFLGQKGKHISTTIGFTNVNVDDKPDKEITAISFMCRLT